MYARCRNFLQLSFITNKCKNQADNRNPLSIIKSPVRLGIIEVVDEAGITGEAATVEPPPTTELREDATTEFELVVALVVVVVVVAVVVVVVGVVVTSDEQS
jgi:hypothetical protein